MPRITIHVGGREPLRTTISKGTPLGLLSTDAIVYVGQVSITGRPAALRALADALVEAAGMAEAYDADPDGWNQRDQAERGPTVDRSRCSGPRASPGRPSASRAGQPPPQRAPGPPTSGRGSP